MKLSRSLVASVAFGLTVVLIAAAFVFFVPDLKFRTSAWTNPVITQGEVNALGWVRANTTERTVFVCDIFGGEFVMGNTLRECTEGGDWAIVPNVVRRMSEMDNFYTISTSADANALAHKYNASYVWVPNRQVYMGFGWKDINRTKFDDTKYFTLVYNGTTKIYQVK